MCKDEFEAAGDSTGRKTKGGKMGEFSWEMVRKSPEIA